MKFPRKVLRLIKAESGTSAKGFNWCRVTMADEATYENMDFSIDLDFNPVASLVPQTRYDVELDYTGQWSKAYLYPEPKKS